MRVGTLGPLSVDGRHELPPRDRTVLAALALDPGRHLHTDQLIDALWGESAPPSATKVVQGCISRLRRLLGPESIETDAHGYRLAIAPDEVDHIRFSRLVGEANDLAQQAQPERAASTLESAIDLWRGVPMLDLADWEPARIVTIRLEELRIQAEERRIDSMIRAGRHEDVLADARALVDAAPTRERRWALLAQAQYASGQQGDALRTLQRARRALVEELGIDPGAELIDLEQSILQQDPSLDVITAVDADAACPYRGLAPYDVDDAAEYFGRDHELDAARRHLRREGVLLVVGPSGSGKSSLARAGIAAALRREGTQVAVCTPSTLRQQGGPPRSNGAALVVDQLEEVFSLPEAEREAVLDGIVEHAAVGLVVATLRSDHLGGLSGHPAAARLLRRGVHLVGPMNDDELREAITGPAGRAGLQLEPGLVDLLVQECRTEPGALPLLSYALRETWMRRDGRTLTVGGYRESGGVPRAISQAGEFVYGQLSADQQRALRSIALRLVAPSDGEPTRRRVRSSDVAPDPERKQLIETLVRARLLTRDADSVTLAHEAVARAWPRFRAWLDDDVASAEVLAHLSSQAATWDEMGRPASELYRGARLVSALEWRDRNGPDLLEIEAAFLDASAALVDEQRTTMERRLSAQARSNRRLRVALAVGACAVIITAVAGAVAVRESARAESSAREADAGRLGALALSVPDADHSLLLAAEAVRIDESNDTRGSLLTALGRVPALVGSAVLPGPGVALAASPDGRWIVAGGPSVGLSVLDAESLASEAVVDQPVASVAFSADGTMLAVGTNRYSPVEGAEAPTGPAIVLYEADGRSRADEQPVGLDDRVEVPDVDFSGDGRWLAAVTRDEQFGTQLLVWDVDRFDEPSVVVNFDGEAYRVELAPDGSRAYVVVVGDPAAAAGRTTRVISLPSGSEAARLDVGGDGLDLSEDGTLLAVTDLADEPTTTIRLFDTTSLDEVATVSRPGSPVASLDLSADGKLLAATDRSNRSTVWDVGALQVVEEFGGHAGQVWSVGFAADGERLLTTGLDRRVLAWDLTGADRVIPRDQLLFARSSQAVVPSPDGRHALSVSGSHLEFAETGSPNPTSVESGHGQTWSVAWHPVEIHRVFTSGDDGLVREWDARTGEVRARHRVSPSSVRALSALPGGSELVFGSTDGTVGVLDVDVGTISMETDLGRQVLAIAAHGDRAAVLVHDSVVFVDLADGTAAPALPLGFVPARGAFDPTGTRLAIVGVAGETGLLDAVKGSWIHEPITVHDDTVFSVAFADDGATFVTGGLDGQLVLWDGVAGAPIAAVRPASGAATLVPTVLEDGTTIVAGSTDLSLYRWMTDTESLVEQACRLARRELTAIEWADAIGDREREKTCP